jgi:hypothetical protein
MKFVLAYQLRQGASAADNLASGEAAQKLLATWSPSPTATVHQWVQRCDGNGGFAVVENDSAADLFKDLSVWNPWLEFQVYPVIDIVESMPITTEVIGIAKSAF